MDKRRAASNIHHSSNEHLRITTNQHILPFYNVGGVLSTHVNHSEQVSTISCDNLMEQTTIPDNLGNTRKPFLWLCSTLPLCSNLYIVGRDDYPYVFIVLQWNIRKCSPREKYENKQPTFSRPTQVLQDSFLGAGGIPLEASSRYFVSAKACHGPESADTCDKQKRRGVRFHGARDFKHYRFDGIPPSSRGYSQFASQDLRPSGPNPWKVLQHCLSTKRCPGHPTLGTNIVQSIIVIRIGSTID